MDGSVGIIVAAHNSLCTNHIFKFGTEEQQQKYVVPLAQGKKLGCWSLTEPEAGSDAGGTRTVAAQKDGGWVINGSKTFTTNGHYADVCVAMAVTDAAKKHHGISAFIDREGNAGIPSREKRKQAGPARQRHERSGVHRLPRAGGESAGHRGRRLRQQPADSRWRAHFDCVARAGHGAGRVRMRGALREAAQAIRQGDRGISGHPVQAGGHGHANRSGAPADVSRGVAGRSGDRVRRRAMRASRANPAWPSFTPEKSPCAWPTKPCKSTAATASSRIIPPRNIYRDVKLCTIGEGTSEIQRMVIARQLLGK